MKKDFEKLDEALKEFIYQFSKSIGLICIVNKISFLELKSWIKDKEKRFSNENK